MPGIIDSCRTDAFQKKSALIPFIHLGATDSDSPTQGSPMPLFSGNSSRVPRVLAGLQRGLQELILTIGETGPCTHDCPQFQPTYAKSIPGAASIQRFDRWSDKRPRWNDRHDAVSECLEHDFRRT